MPDELRDFKALAELLTVMLQEKGVAPIDQNTLVDLIEKCRIKWDNKPPPKVEIQEALKSTCSSFDAIIKRLDTIKRFYFFSPEASKALPIDVNEFFNLLVGIEEARTKVKVLSDGFDVSKGGPKGIGDDAAIILMAYDYCKDIGFPTKLSKTGYYVGPLVDFVRALLQGLECGRKNPYSSLGNKVHAVLKVIREAEAEPKNY